MTSSLVGDAELLLQATAQGGDEAAAAGGVVHQLAGALQASVRIGRRAGVDEHEAVVAHGAADQGLAEGALGAEDAQGEVVADHPGQQYQQDADAVERAALQEGAPAGPGGRQGERQPGQQAEANRAGQRRQPEQRASQDEQEPGSPARGLEQVARRRASTPTRAARVSSAMKTVSVVTVCSEISSEPFKATSSAARKPARRPKVRRPSW